LAVQVLDRHSIPIESDLGPSGLSLSNFDSTNLVLSAATVKEKATSKTTAGSFTHKRSLNPDIRNMQDLPKPRLHWHLPASHPETEIYFDISLYIYVARLWIHGALYNQPVCGFTGHIYFYCLTVVSRGLFIFVTWQWFHGAYISMSPVCGFAAFLSIVYYRLDCGFTESGGSIISFISYGVCTKSIIISLYSLLSSRQERQFYLWHCLLLLYLLF
jgi:hypothetical protein